MAASIITKISPVASIVGIPTVMVITGNNFTDGGNPSVWIDNVLVTPSAFSDTQITLNLGVGVGVGVGEGIHNVVVLNGANT